MDPRVKRTECRSETARIAVERSQTSGAVPLLLVAAVLLLAANALLLQTVSTDLGQSRQTPRIVAFSLFALAIFVGRVRIPFTITALIVIAGVGLIVGRNPDQFSLIFALLGSAAMVARPHREVLRTYTLAAVFALAAIFAFLEYGLTTDLVLDLRNRRTFGVQGIGFLFNIIFGALTLGFAWVDDRAGWTLRWVALVAITMAGYWFFVKTDGRAGFMSLLIFVVIYVVGRLLSRKALGLAVASIPGLLLVSSVYLALTGRRGTLDTVLSHRPTYWRSALDSYEWWEYFSSSSVKAFDTTTIVDNSYLHLLLGSGVVLAGCLLVVWSRALYRAAAQGDLVSVAFMVACSAYFIAESILFRVEVPFIGYFWYLMIKFGIDDVARQESKETT